MGQKQCPKCGDFVDEAKAFCPGCGHAFVDEKKRTSVSDFDRSNPTVQLDNSMFNQMLSDMGLNISKEPTRETPRVEVIAPVVQPTKALEPSRSKYRNWIIAGAIALLLFLALAALIIAAAFVLYFRQTD
jgi:uncharacterized Zn finger protein (UPF0148 family)